MSKGGFLKFWNNWNTDRIVGLSAMFISLLTLVTFVFQTNLMKKQTSLSVLPYLSVSASFNSGDDPSFKLSLINQGVGPAIIESRKVFYQGKEYDQDFHEFVKTQMPKIDSLDGISHGSIDFGSVIPSGEEIYLIAAFDDLNSVLELASTIEAFDDDDQLDYEIIYRSIYDERWKITSNNSWPLKLPKKPRGEK